LLFGTIVPAILAIEVGFVGWRKSSLHYLFAQRTPSGMTDLSIFLLSVTNIKVILSVLFSLGFVLISGPWLYKKLHDATGYSLSIVSMPVVAQIVILYLVFTFFDYWNHRLDHSDRFWPLHRYHHAADDFSVLTSVRTHPAAFTTIISTVPPLLLLQASPAVSLSVVLFVLGHRYVIHSRIDSDFGWFGRLVLQSPVHHRLHHVLNTTGRYTHLGLIPLWDHVFGTWRDDGDPSLPIGVATPYRHGGWLAQDLWRDYCDFWRGIVGSRSADAPRPPTISA
jgi:sterol desaturase/sphingolipid hydroxylase (fatty acid hydroxylase superfamily)